MKLSLKKAERESILDNMSELCTYCKPWGYCKKIVDGAGARLASNEAQKLAEEGKGNADVRARRILHRREGANQYRRDTDDGLYQNCTQT